MSTSTPGNNHVTTRRHRDDAAGKSAAQSANGIDRELTNGSGQSARQGDSELQITRSTLHRRAPMLQQRHQLIAEAAYRRAEQRGFEPGHELNDWLAAEAEVDAAGGERDISL